MSSEMIAAVVGGAIGIFASVLSVLTTFGITVRHERRKSDTDIVERWRVGLRLLESHRRYYELDQLDKGLDEPVEDTGFMHIRAQSFLAALPDTLLVRLLRYDALVHELNSCIRRRQELIDVNLMVHRPPPGTLVPEWNKKISALREQGALLLNELLGDWIAASDSFPRHLRKQLLHGSEQRTDERITRAHRGQPK